MCWFTYDDNAANMKSAPGGNFMGLLRADGSRKPSFAAYVKLAASAK